MQDETEYLKSSANNAQRLEESAQQWDRQQAVKHHIRKLLFIILFLLVCVFGAVWVSIFPSWYSGMTCAAGFAGMVYISFYPSEKF